MSAICSPSWELPAARRRLPRRMPARCSRPGSSQQEAFLLTKLLLWYTFEDCVRGYTPFILSLDRSTPNRGADTCTTAFACKDTLRLPGKDVWEDYTSSIRRLERPCSRDFSQIRRLCMECSYR